MSNFSKIPNEENETIAVIADTLESSLKEEVSNLSTTQKDEFYEWLCGKKEKMPDFVEGLVNNLAFKINTSMGYLCAMSVARLYKLSKFMNDAEDILFDPNTLVSLSTKELTDIYKTASTTITQTMEFIRRYLAQNQESINFDTNSGSSTVTQILSTLPPEKLSQLKALFMSQT